MAEIVRAAERGGIEPAALLALCEAHDAMGEAAQQARRIACFGRAVGWTGVGAGALIITGWLDVASGSDFDAAFKTLGAGLAHLAQQWWWALALVAGFYVAWSAEATAAALGRHNAENR